MMNGITVDILTPDVRFGRMLVLEMERIGADVYLGEYRKQVHADVGKRFVIADLDTCSEADLDAIDASCTLIGFSSKYEYEMTGSGKVCNVFLHRPFLMSELLGIVGEDESYIVKHYLNEQKSSGAIASKNNVLRVNPEKRCAVWGNMEIPLSDNEYRVLEFLCSRRGELVCRDEIDELLGVEDGNMSDVYICHLRRKLDNKLGLKLICTVRGKGYTLNN